MRNQFFTRSLFVAFCALFICVSAMAVDLNPFAYRIGNYKATNMVEKSGASLNNDKFVINYALSGDATSVIVRFWNASSTWTRANANNGATLLAEIDITNEKDSEGNDCYKKGYHTYTLDFTHVVGQSTTAHNQALRWTIDVKGGNQSDDYIMKSVVVNESGGKANRKFINAKEVTEFVGFRYPGSVDICDDPYDYNFGAVFCTESRVVDAGDDPSYISYGKNPTIYVFGGGMEYLPAFYKGKETYYSLNGLFKDAWHFGSGTTRLYARAPHRVRIAEDGRIFLSAAEGREQSILYELTKPKNLSQNNFYEHNDGSDRRLIFNEGQWVPGKVYLQTTGSKFIAAPNVGMDLRGVGSNLELLLLSADIRNKNSIDYTQNPTSGTMYPGSNQNEWHLDRYQLGNKTTWGDYPTTEDVMALIKVSHNSVATNELTDKLTAIDGTKLGSAIFAGYDNTGIEYDPNGGFWAVQYRQYDGVAATMLHYNAKTKRIDFEEHVAGRTSGGVRHNHDFTKLAVAGGYKVDSTLVWNTNKKSYKGQAAREKHLTIYSVTYNNSTGGYTFTDSAYIESNKGGFHDFAWDFADNLYAAANGSNRLMAFALPHQNKTVSTPSMSQFNFKMSPVYAFNVAVSPTVAGADTYASVIHERIGKAPYPNYLHNALMNLRADVLTGCKFYKWTGQTGTHTTDGNKLVINNLASAQNITAQIGICAYENKAVLAVKAETTFPAAFVQRELDDISYSTICLPFHLESLEGTPYQGASVLELKSSTVNSDGDSRVFLNFEEVVFGAGKGMRAGKPYLIQLPKDKELQSEEIFTDVTCPVLSGTNACGGLDVNCGNGITFHAIMNPNTITVNENTLFLTADNRLVTLYGQNSVNINGLRGYFTVSGGMAKTAEFVLNLPEKVVTSTPMVNLADSLQVTKYLWNGQIYIQRGNEVYDLSGVRVK